MELMELYLCMGKQEAVRRLLCLDRKKNLFSTRKMAKLKKLNSLLLGIILKIMGFCSMG